MDPVLQKAQELAQAIRESEAYQNMKRCEADMQNSETARQANEIYEETYRAVRKGIQDGTHTREEAVHLLDTAKKTRDASPEIAAYMQAEGQFHQMMENVNQLLQIIVTDRIGSEGSGCPGDCSACRGCGR